MQTVDNTLDALWQQQQHLSGYAHLRRFSVHDFERSRLLRWWARTHDYPCEPVPHVANVKYYFSL